MRKPRKTPWVLHQCPENKHNTALLIFKFIGLIAHILFFVAGLLGIFLTPLFLVEAHPDAPISAPMVWLRSHFSHEMVIFIYAAVSLCIAGVLTYAMNVFDYLYYWEPKQQKDDAV